MYHFFKSALLSMAAITLVTPSFAAPYHEKVRTDANITNKEQVLYWLIKRGELEEGASELEKQMAVDAFTKRAYEDRKVFLDHSHFPSNRLEYAKQVSKSKTHSEFQSESFEHTKVKVLTVLIDFPDLPYDENGLTSSDTAMFYDDYSVEHYKSLLFSETGYDGPQGQRLLTGYQYYQEESGGSFFFTGDVKGWYRAGNNAAYYGSNDASNNDSAVSDLVKEAVTAAAESMTAAELASYDIRDPYDLDNDGITNEPDSYLDHVMIFHSSIGEEAGGGMLGTDAIWSHRSFVDNGNYALPDTQINLAGYTIQPIDAALGVCVHEFAHDLGLPDEYDTTTQGKGSPVGFWSLMASGSWAGSLPGAQPTGFSPYARTYLQSIYGGNWVREQTVELETIGVGGVNVDLVEAINHQQVNQVSVPIPSSTVDFKTPISGDYQYYSDQGDMINHAMSFNIDLPLADSLVLKMKAHWNIEQNYDYAQVLVDGVAVEGNFTLGTNYINNERNIITGRSSDLPEAVGADAWVELEFDMSSYADKNVQISIRYKTDQAVGDYGIVIDDIELLQAGNSIYFDGAEVVNSVDYNGFLRITDKRPGKSKRYIVQLRSHHGVDKGLASASYEPGIVLWLENQEYTNNEVHSHPGYSLISVIDADQNLIAAAETDVQIRDAAFSLFNQDFYFNDDHLSSNSLFDDSDDYSAPLQSESGTILPEIGLTMEVIAQSANTSTATVKFEYTGPTEPGSLSFSIDYSLAGRLASFSANVTGGDGVYTYFWDFGVVGGSSTKSDPRYTFATNGRYVVTLTVTDGAGATLTESIELSLEAVEVNFGQTISDLQVEFNNETTGGIGQLSYLWDFGDGTTSNNISPSHTYRSGGTYVVTLTVTDQTGAAILKSESITVSAAAVVSGEDEFGGGTFGWLSIILLGSLTIFRRRKIA